MRSAARGRRVAFSRAASPASISSAPADSGLDLLHSWDLEPDLIVGDFDSLSDIGLLSTYPDARVLRFPRDKDESDTEIGLRMLFELGLERVVLAGGGGGRLDHLLAIRSSFERPIRPDEWHGPRESVYCVKEGGRLDLAASVGDTISIFPLSRGASMMESSGLVWPLAGLRWGPGDYGLSNRAQKDEVRIAAGKGDPPRY